VITQILEKITQIFQGRHFYDVLLTLKKGGIGYV